MSSPSWITPVRFAPRPAFSRPKFATDFAARENSARALPVAADPVGSLIYRLDRRSRKGDLLRGYVSDEIRGAYIPK